MTIQLWLAGIGLAVIFALVGVIFSQVVLARMASLKEYVGELAKDIRHDIELIEKKIDIDRQRLETWRHEKWNPVAGGFELLKEKVLQLEKWKNGKP